MSFVRTVMFSSIWHLYPNDDELNTLAKALQVTFGLNLPLMYGKANRGPRAIWPTAMLAVQLARITLDTYNVPIFRAPLTEKAPARPKEVKVRSHAPLFIFHLAYAPSMRTRTLQAHALCLYVQAPLPLAGRHQSPTEPLIPDLAPEPDVVDGQASSTELEQQHEDDGPLFGDESDDASFAPVRTTAPAPGFIVIIDNNYDGSKRLICEPWDGTQCLRQHLRLCLRQHKRRKQRQNQRQRQCRRRR
eukprot:6183500-Pleurochrysis_carterae.AAC.5